MEVDMNQLTKIALTWELYEEDIPKTHIAERLGVHRETVRTWISGISSNTLGLTGFIEEYQKAKKGQRKKRKLDGRAKRSRGVFGAARAHPGRDGLRCRSPGDFGLYLS